MTPLAKKSLAFAAALTAAGSAFAAVSSMTPTARGILESGPLPVASREEVAAVVTTLGTVQAQVAKQAAQSAATDKLLALTRQQQLEGMLSEARNDYRKAPSPPARAYVCELIAQVDALRRQNGLPQIPPCQ